MFIFYTTCWKSLHFFLFNFQSVCHSSFILIILSFNLFASFAQRRFMSLFVRIKQHIWLCQSLQSDSSQSAVLFLILVPMMSRGSALINTNLTILFVILAKCKYTHLFWVMFLQWVLWGTTIWLAFIFLLFVIFLRVCNKKRLFLISYCLLQQNCKLK